MLGRPEKEADDLLYHGGISLPAQISCLRGRHFEWSRYKAFQLNIGCSGMVCLCMRLPF